MKEHVFCIMKSLVDAYICLKAKFPECLYPAKYTISMLSEISSRTRLVEDGNYIQNMLILLFTSVLKQSLRKPHV